MFASVHARGNFPILRECAEYFSPLIEETSGDTITFEISGLDHLIGSPDQIARAIENRIGIPANIAIAANPDEGVHLQKLARGEGHRLLRCVEAPLNFAEELELDYPVEQLEPLSFLLARLLNDLCARLASRAFAAHQLRLRLKLENAPDHAAAL